MKKFIILASLFAMIAHGMLEKRGNYGHIRMCSAPGGLWSLEEDAYIHRRTFSAPTDFKPSVNQKLRCPHLKKSEPNTRSKKRKSSKFSKKINEKPSEILKSKPEPKPREPMNSTKQKIINAKNQQRETDLNIAKVLKKKSFEKKFTNFLGNNIGKLVADTLFDLLKL